jgi:hypothetical protein
MPTPKYPSSGDIGWVWDVRDVDVLEALDDVSRGRDARGGIHAALEGDVQGLPVGSELQRGVVVDHRPSLQLHVLVPRSPSTHIDAVQLEQRAGVLAGQVRDAGREEHEVSIARGGTGVKVPKRVALRRRRRAHGH